MISNNSLYTLLEFDRLDDYQIQKPVLTFRNEASLAFIRSSMSFMVSERAEICMFISSSFCFIVWIFCSSSSHIAVIIASCSSMRNWWSFLNSSFIRRSVCWAWVSKRNRKKIQWSFVLSVLKVQYLTVYLHLDVLNCFLTLSFYFLCVLELFL